MENLANVNVPGYKRKDMSMDISFADALGSATQSAGVVSGSGLSLSPSDELSQDSNASSIRQDGNNVDLEKEVMSIAETQLRYQTLSTAVTKSFSDLKTAIGN